MHCQASLIIILAGSLALAAKVPKADSDQIEGDWEVVTIRRDGGWSEGGKQIWKFRNGYFWMVWGEHPEHTVKKVFALFPNEQPKQMDFKTRLEHSKAIYRIDGDDLLICHSGQGPSRPTEFTDQRQDLVVLKRLKKPSERWFLPDNILVPIRNRSTQ